jgi:hypothetical protein
MGIGPVLVVGFFGTNFWQLFFWQPSFCIGRGLRHPFAAAHQINASEDPVSPSGHASPAMLLYAVIR